VSDTRLPLVDDRPAPAAPDARVHLLGLTPPELRAVLKPLGWPNYRVDQLLDWTFAKRAADFEQMSNLPKDARRWLAEHATLYRGQVTRESASQDGTRKLLSVFPDGGVAETVWIPEAERNTACLSSQVGCPVGCRFCASGVGGVERDLTAGEIVEQAQRIRRLIGAEGRLSNVVYMGMGEPLANYDNVLKSIRILNAEWGLGIGARKITVSTVGLPRQIRRLADEDLQLNLALSLHAPTDELRAQLIPWKVPIDELLAACRDYFERTGREITFEYVLLAGVNDHMEHADKLAILARRVRANINLLRYNEVPGLPYRRPSAAASQAFLERLRARGANAHIRTSRGRDIDAACGQLRRAALPTAGA